MAKPTLPSLVGQRFGKLIVIEKLVSKGKRNSVYLCKCDCGNTTQVTRPNLRHSQVRSCGCLRHQHPVVVTGVCSCGAEFAGTKSRKSCPACAVKNINIKANLRNRELKREMIEAYGGKCVCCGLSDWRFLGIDHIHNDGATERKELYGEKGGYSSAGGGISFYRKLRQRGYPKDRYQLMCFNCNTAKAIYGECPHSTDHTHGVIVPLDYAEKNLVENVISTEAA